MTDSRSFPRHAGCNRSTFLHGVKPGVNTDMVDPDACAREAASIGWSSPEDAMITHYAGMRWMRGEESQAINMLLNHGIDLTGIHRILAAGRAAAALAAPNGEDADRG